MKSDTGISAPFLFYIDLKSLHNVGVFRVLAHSDGTMLQLTVKTANVSTKNSNGDAKLRSTKAN